MDTKNDVFRKLVLTLLLVSSLSGLMGQIQIGTGTANEYLPIRPWWDYSYSQVIYLQSEINASGDITELQWYFDGSSLSNSNDWTIYIGHTSKTEFLSGSDWIAVSSLTQVWSGTFSDPGSSGWLSFDITDFYYNNSDNLVIAVDENEPDDNGYSDYFHNTSVSTYRGLVEYSFSNIDPASPPEGTRKKYIANIKIVMGSSTCPAPSDLTETNITQTTVDLGWTENGSATTWDIEYGAAGFSLGTGTQVTGIASNPYSLSGLTANTEYDWYVRSDCGGGDVSSWSGPGNFTTLAAVQTLPFTEDWESGGIGSAWNTYTAGYAVMQVNAVSKHNGSYGLEQYADGGSYTTPSGMADAYAKAQPGEVNASHTSWNYFSIDLSAATAPELSFWYALGRSYNNNYNFFWVQIDDGSGWTDLFATQPDGGPIPYERKTFDLSSYTGGTVDIRFFHNGKYDNDYLYLDDILVSEFTCPAPTDQSVSNITTTSVDLGWTENGTSTSWDIEWGAPGFTQGTGTMISGTTSNPFSLSGLLANTAYDWYVRADCGGGSSSNWTGPHTFSTTINSFPWTEGFENGGSIPDGWTQEYVSGIHNWVFQTGGHNNSNPSNAHTGTYNAAFTHTSSGTKTKLITPQLDLDGQSNPQLRFWHTQAVYDGDQDELRVYYKTNAGGSWTMIAEYTSSITSWTQEIINLPNTSSTYYIAFEGYDDYGYGVCIDDVEVSISSCPAPSSLYADIITQTSANLNWTTGGASTWNIEYGPEGFTQGAGTMITGTTSNPYSLSGLAAGTAYDFYVQDDCGGGSQSSWSGPSSFTTLCDAVNTFPWTEDFENGGNRPDCWTEEYNVGSHDWVFQDGGDYTPFSAHGGSYNAAFVHETTSSSTKLITPPMDLSALTNPQISFWHTQAAYYGDQDELRVYYKTSSTGSWTLIPGAEFISEVAEWTEVVLSLPNPGAEYFIAFEGTDGGGQGVCIDDVEVDGSISCLPPTNLFASNIGSTSVDLNWTTGGATTWNIEWGPVGFVQENGTLITGTTNNPHSLSGLSANTVYDFYVQDDCGGSQSTWAGPATFCTLIDIFPWTEDFENGGNRPDGWSEEYVSGTIDWEFRDGGDGGIPANAHAGSYNAEFSFNIGDATMLITPVFDLTALTDPALDFWHTQHEFMGGQSTLTVYYRISENDPWTLVPGGNYTAEVDEWTIEILDLPSPSAAYQIAFKATDGGGTGVCVDDVRVMENTPMQWVSSTCTQNTDYSYRANFQQIIGIEIETQYIASPIEITSFKVNTNGGSVYWQNINDFSIYYTGTSNVFDERNLFNDTTVNPTSGGPTNYDITGSQFLTEGTNYFWLAVNVEPTAVPGETIDAECLQITTASKAVYVPDITAPAGNSEIHTDMAWTGAISNDWNNSGNWDPQGPPDPFIPIVVPYDATNNLQLNGDLVVHGYGGDYNCYSLEIQLAATVTNTGDLDCFGDMEVAGTYTSTNNTSNSHKINSGGELSITSSGVVNIGNNINGEADLIVGSDIHSGGTLMNIGGELYVADQIYLHDNATVITGSQAIIFAGKGGGGSPYSSDNPATFYVEDGALGNIMNATIKVCGKTAPGYNTVDIQSSDFDLSFNATFEICHGDAATHYDANVSIVDSADMVNFIINKPGNEVLLQSNLNCAGDFIVKPEAQFTVDAGNTISVAQDFKLESDANGTASFINYGSLLVGGQTTMECWIAGYGGGGDLDGWHFLSSPVAGQSMLSGGFSSDAANFDFYRWDEPGAEWENWKQHNWGTFTVGKGYLVAYEAGGSKTFTADENGFNTVNVGPINVTNNGLDPRGFNLLGNPYPSALTWDDAWSPGSVATYAKIWRESSASYIDIDDGEIIPALNGFMVYTYDAATTFTIAASDRTHDATAWYKDTEQKIMLLAHDIDQEVYQESVIKFDESATPGFDQFKDSRFLYGYAPALYSFADDVKISTNAMAWNPDMIIPFRFEKNASSSFMIELAESIEGQDVYLKDLKTNTTVNLGKTGTYTFSSEEGDDQDRFQVLFGVVGIEDIQPLASARVYSNGDVITVANLQGETRMDVIDLQGRVLQTEEFNSNGYSTFDFELSTGIYLVRLYNSGEAKTTKVFVK